MNVREIETPHGPARAHLSPVESPRALLVLGHGAGGGVTAPDLVTAAEVRAQLETLAAVAEGRAEGGRVAALPQSERFHWLTAPSSTIVQPSAVHTGLTDDPGGELGRLFDSLVSRTGKNG